MLSTTLGGIAGLAAPRWRATIEAMAGYFSASLIEPRLGVEIGRLKNLVRLVIAESRVDRADDRELVHHRRLLGQVLAQRARPAACVRIVENGPRISRGASGLTSQVSMWLGPPVIHSRMTLLPPGSGLPPARRLAAEPQQIGQRKARHAGQAGFEHAAAAGDAQPFVLARVQVAKGMLSRLLGQVDP